ncbi:MAG: hydrogenase expression/formation protein [Candidatus Lokiarchaeota archaeon]|nr:hydrogenase expression/formation protein [Candidatus Lokiarchaeota archaeon]
MNKNNSKESNTKEKSFLPLGKLKLDLLKEIFTAYNSPEIMNLLESSPFKNNYKSSKERVKLGFAIGEDAAVIDVGEKYLILKTDPITFTTDEIGYYVVNVNANDVVSMGAIPRWFQVTILLPPNKTTSTMAKKICLDIQKCCLKMGILLVGGHTEVTYGLERPIVIGSMFGEVDKKNLVLTSGAKSGDALVLTKGVPLEGTSIIAREKEAELHKNGISKEKIERSKELLHNPGISVLKEALLATKHFNIHSMHDPTEGGLAMGLVEMAKACDCGFLVEKEKIPIIPEGEILCSIYDLDPLQVISSGALLIALEDNDSDSLIRLLRKNDIIASKIGVLTEHKKYQIKAGNKIKEIEYSETDQLTKIL